MWTHTFQTKTELEPKDIWPVLANVSGWPELDHNIDRIQIESEPAAGVSFTLKPKGGPRLRFRIGSFEPPEVYSDICILPLATMTTRHTLTRDSSAETLVSVEIVIEGFLSPFWGLVVGRKHASGLPAQTARILAHARSLSTRRG
jgi:Polyketide cyclase / dehydrase and lipid transport